jgi:hypothetical protein
MIRFRVVGLLAAALAWTAWPAHAGEFHLLTGVDVQQWPGTARDVSPSPGPGFPGPFRDGDRLAGTSDSGGTVDYVGTGTPIFAPNQFGALSFVFKRASVPAGGSNQVPLMGIDFLGGPLVDLDGDVGNGERSLIPVSGQTAVPVPDTASLVDLVFDLDGGTAALDRLDVTGTSEGGPSQPADIAVTVNVLAGTSTNGIGGEAINPSIDTRLGDVSAYTGTSGALDGVYRIENLGYEIWQDTLFSGSATASVLGTFQYLGTFSGWMIERDPVSGQFPMLAGEGLGSTLWPLVNTNALGETYNTANGLVGGMATIGHGPAADDFLAAGEGGLPLTDFGGDLGAYLDAVVTPNIDPQSDRFVYLQSAGFGINNSSDPIYFDSIGYDVVLVAEEVFVPDGDADSDGDVDLHDCAALQRCFTGPGPQTLEPGCDVFDHDFNTAVDSSDYAAFADLLTGPH